MRIVHSILNVTDIILSKNQTEISILNSTTPLFTVLNFNINNTDIRNLEDGLWLIYIKSVSYPLGEVKGKLIESTTYVLPPTASTLVLITWKTWVNLTILLIMMISLVFEFLESFGLIFATVILLNLFGILSMDQVKQGFANEAMLTVAVLNIVFEPIKRTTLPSILFKKIVQFLD